MGERFGGRQADLATVVRVARALGEGDPSVALIALQTIGHHTRQAASDVWPAHLYERFLAESLERPTLTNALRAEPGIGSPSRGGLPATTARRTDTGWAIDGRKVFGTGSGGLAYHVVWATTDEPEPRVANFLVPGDTPGIEVVPTWDHLGLRASNSHDVVYRDVHVPEDHIFSAVPAGPGAQQDNLTGSGLQLAIVALYVGVARAAQAWLHDFAWHKVPPQLGHPVAETERLRNVAGEIEARLTLGEEVLDTLATRIGAGDRALAQRSLAARTLVARDAISAVELAVRALGNPALSRNNPLERHLRDVLCARVHAPQEDTAIQILGRHALEAARPASLDQPA